jgi:hypothetical protein
MFYILYIIVVFLLLEPIYKLCSFNLLNENSLFLILSNYLLNIGVVIFYFLFSNLLLSLIFITLLSIFTILLIFNFKHHFGYFKLTSIPYLLLVLFSNTYILISFIESI